MPHLYVDCSEADSYSLRSSFLVLYLACSWQCIYHWLRSNQEYLTCPLCKSGLELSSVRPILIKNQPPEKDEGGVPPRPRPFKKIKQNKNLRDIPKTILSMGMNVQRGVMLAGYGIFPSAYQCLFHNFKEPQMGQDRIGNSNKQYNIYRYTKYATWLIVAIAIAVLILY